MRESWGETDSILKENEPSYATNTWSRRVVQPVLISLLVTALTAAVLVIFEIITEDGWRAAWPLALFVILEGCYTTIWLGEPGQRLVTRAALRGSELVLLALVTRLFSWFIFAGSFPELELREYVVNPFLLIDVKFVVLFVLLVVSWNLGNLLTRLFNELAVDEAEVAYFLLPRHLRDNNARPVSIDRSLLVAEFFRYWIWGGTLLAILLAMSTFALPEVSTSNLRTLPRLNLRFDMLAAVLVYFISGFLLLSQGRLAVLNARWLLGGAHKSGELERRWHRMSLLLLLLICLGAAFLPLGSTFLLARIVEWMLAAVITIGAYLIFLFLTLLSYIVNLFGGGEPVTEQPAPPRLIEPLLPPPAESAPIPPPDSGIPVVSLLLWALIIIALVEALLYFLNARGYKVPRHLLPAVWRALVRGWRRLWGGLRRRARAIKLTRPAFLARQVEKAAASAAGRRRRAVRWQDLSPRERVRYFYLSTLDQAAAEGVPRPAGLTPAEYARRLLAEWPDAAADINALTSAFEEARYTPHEIVDEDADETRTVWQRTRQQLRRPAGGS